jgi:TRAP-type C4-dicarboxylate transport system permease small subunit
MHFPMGHQIDKLSLAINQGVEYLLAAMGLAMTVVVAAQVFFRYGLNASLFWSEELARYLLVWLTFLGASTAFRRGAHPGIDLFSTRLPAPLQRIARRLVQAVCLAVFAVMVVYGIEFSWFVRMQISPALGWPKWVVFAAVPVSGAILAVHALAFLTTRRPGGDP